MDSLEQTLIKGLDEAQKLFSQGLAPTARYVLSTIKARYNSENQSIADELNALQEDFDRSIKKDYPPKIISALKASDFKKAASLFSVYIAYTYETGRVPEHMKGLQDDIRKGNAE